VSWSEYAAGHPNSTLSARQDNAPLVPPPPHPLLTVYRLDYQSYMLGKMALEASVADPDPGSNDFLTSGSGMGKKYLNSLMRIRIRDPESL
jgi:hypothetical protein